MDASAVSDMEHTVGAFQRRTATLICVLLVAGGILLTPVANQPWLPVPGYMTAFGMAMVITNIMLTMLLFGRGATENNRVIVSLGTAYFFVAMIFLPLMAAFPGGIMPGELIGSQVSAVWLWSFWHAGFGVLVLRFAYLVGGSRVRRSQPWKEAAITLLAVIVLTLVSTVGVAYLPPLYVDGKTFFSGYARCIPWSIMAIDMFAAIKLLRLPQRTPEQLWLTVGMFAACFDVWLTFHGTSRFSLGWYVSKVAGVFTSMVVLVSLFRELSQLYRRVYQTNVVLSALANQDGLTSLANRRRFDEILKAEWGRAQRYHQPISLLMIDVDHFKKFNDRFGHLDGDDCLRVVGKVLRDCSKRPDDLAARYGGEEFAMVLPFTSASGADALARRICQVLGELAIPHPDAKAGVVSVSIGVATMVPNAEMLPEKVISAADSALYLAKEAGRNCVRHASDMMRAMPAKYVS